ncbi:putative ribonuclease H-like domain-containing protein [Tanacetum coccineum]|uniref:Ribonuclease H-like domain-containing protein n=1 Tax=Tanacetum coccineum TaxID=301880 RepID=A0ABQ5IU44_9ASTR
MKYREVSSSNASTRNLQAQLEAKIIEEEKLARKQQEEANIALIDPDVNTGSSKLNNVDPSVNTAISIDYALWEVIKNGNSWVSIPQTAQENGTSVIKISVPVTAEEKTNKKNDVKARSLLLMALPNEHQLTFSQYPDAKSMIQKIVSRIAILGVVIAQEDLNSKFLSNLPPEWNNHVVVWMNKPEVNTMSIDDQYNNFKIVEQKVKKSVGASSASTTSPNVNTASPQVSIASFSDNAVYAFMVENPNGSNLLHQDLEQIHEDDLEAMDLKWQLSLLSMRAKRYYQRTGKKIFINANDTARYDKSKVECFNCHKMGHFARECRAPRSKEGQFRNQDNTRKKGNNEDTSSKEMLAIDGVGFDWSDMAEEQIKTNMALMAFSDSEVYNDKTCSKTCLKNFETLKKQCDDLIVKLNQTEFTVTTYKRGLATLEEQLITYRKNEVLFSEEVAVLKRDVACKDYEINMLKSEFEKVKQEKEGIEFKIEKFDKASKDLDQLLGSEITDKGKKGLGYSAVPPPHPLIYNRPKKLDMSYSGLDEFKEPEFKGYGHENSRFVESSLDVDKETVFPVDKKVESVKPKDHEKPVKRPRIVNTARSYRTPINTVRPRVVNIVRSNRTSVNAARANGFNAVKPSACWVWRPIKPNSASINLNRYNYIDARSKSNGCSRHMAGNIAYLSDFKQFDGGYVAFGGGAYNGKISGKYTLKTANLDFEDVYFVNELKFNLFSVSQMCDKKNYVLFTDTECLVLSPNFKLPDENQILLKVPRKDNMYSFDMKNIVPKESLTCLVAKATLDESMLWHKRLGHINFKNINKLVKDNLVRGLPTKRFENDQTCVACLKGKQHRASCKSKVLNPITKPLFMLHMDLFGPTFVSSLMHKKYCLVVTDDYSRFTWVFFLTTKDETSEILKRFIKEIENLVDKKVKIIRSDNGTEFKNKVMDDFCREKGIKREYSVARTPQQNGVAERRNRTLIEAARTMLADSKLPTTFWAEAVSTACYVQNRVLVVKPHNKTPYELFREGIDYDEVFAPVARIKAIRLFLAYASFIGFLVYQMDVKSALLYGTIKEEVHVTQPPGFKDPDHPDKVYKVVKALYGLHQAHTEQCNETWLTTLGNGFKRGKIDQTLFIKKQKGDILLVQKFNYTDVKSASTPVDLEKPLVKDGDADDVDVHLYRSMIGSLMYLIASRPDIMFAAYDSDYAGATQDRKSTTRGCQFLGNRLISWQCKKQTVVATSTTEAEYVAAASCCGQVLWIQNQLLDYGYNFMNTVINIDNNNLLTKGFDAGRHVKRGPVTIQIPQLVGPPIKVGDEAVHKELDHRMERAATTASSLEAEQDNDSLCIDLSSLQSTHLASTVLGAKPQRQKRLMVAKSTAWNEFSSTMASLIICLATNQRFNLSKYIFDAMVKHLDGGVKFLMYPRFLQVFINQHLGDMSHHKQISINPSHIKKIFANMKREGKDFSGRITPLFETMMVQPTQDEGVDSGIPTDSLQTPIPTQPSSSRSQKKQEGKGCSSKIDCCFKEEGLEVGKEKEIKNYRYFDIDDFHGNEVNMDMPVGENQEQSVKEREVDTSVEDSAAPITIEEITLAQTLIQIKAAKPKVNSTKSQTLMIKDKGKGIMIEPEVPLKRKDQVALDEDLARNLQAWLEAEIIEEEKLAKK